MIKIGSLFAGIGGFERGIEAAIPESETIWQVERKPFCQKVLRKHWPHSKIYNDVRDITRENVEPVDMLLGGFPCQDISVGNNKGEGLDGKKSGLWWEMHRIISELRPRVVVMENVSAITLRGGLNVVGSLASIGYDSEWRIISARDFGAPHKRDRWFCVSWTPYSLRERSGEQSLHSVAMESKRLSRSRDRENERRDERNYWKRHESPSSLCRVDDGVSDRLHRLIALGNAIVPQCSEYIGRMILKSGLLS